MPLTYETTFGKHYRRVQGIFFTHLKSIVDPNRKEIRSAENRLSLSVTFSDGSVLQGIETLSKNRHQIEVTSYGYEYQRLDGFFFQYEMEQPEASLENNSEPIAEIEKRAAQIKKPPYHLHVGAKKEIVDLLDSFPGALREHAGPHYPTFPISLDYVLAIIVVNYFPSEEHVLGALWLEDFLS